ncbi:hypothetical protein H0266_04690 [Halobacillus locisalis]|uniref:Uncharacterized protein n=1 Tax=Halobacillus locisalis TaxID=220753 RepID=A0A838CQ52_9BACI|nr:hypothetical protein [Halobacillus locisalis]MBA2174197.1 hypothetical protein [Halobacillus locisalis]
MKRVKMLRSEESTPFRSEIFDKTVVIAMMTKVIEPIDCLNRREKSLSGSKMMESFQNLRDSSLSQCLSKWMTRILH